MMDNPIPRRLAYEDGQDGVAILDDHEIAAIPDPVVILGDPGLGKTVLTQTLGSQPTLTRCGAGRFVRVANLRELMDEGDRIIIDGLDEIASAQPGGGVDAVLRALSQLNNPRFILSCREADWLGASAKSKIREDYQTEPVVLRLLPFEYADAEAFLANEFPELDSAELLDGLAGRGLDGIYQNPLTLRLLGEVVRSDGLLPQSRADLLERACRVMLHEVNPGHLEAAHAHRSDDELLLAAGAICAALLLCDRAGIFNGPPRLAPEDCLKLRDITDLPFAEAAGDALRTRLFQAEGEQRFTHIHRVVAEYLGAKWLARCVPDRCSERRMFRAPIKMRQFIFTHTSGPVPRHAVLGVGGCPITRGRGSARGLVQCRRGRTAEQREPVVDPLSGQALVSTGPLVPSPAPRAQIEPGTEQVEKALGGALVHVEIGA